MSGGFKVLKCLSMVLMLVGYSSCQTQLPEFPTDPRDFDICTMAPANFDVNPGESYSDNFGCLVSGTLTCFQASQLCNGANFCSNGEDEGVSVNSLECNTANPASSTYSCNPGLSVTASDLCNGVNDCQVGDDESTGGDDETAPFCANKCLAPYGGGCTRLNRLCENSAFDVNCGECLDGYFENAQFNCVEEVGFQLDLYVTTEGASQLVCLEISTQPTNPSRTVTINVESAETSPVEAQSGVDFVAFSGSVDFTPTSSTVQCITVQAITDSIPEITECFQLIAEVDAGGPVILDPPTTLVCINDVEPVQFQLDIPETNVMEGTDDDIEICVELISGALPNLETVTLTLGGGDSTAVDDEDYDSSEASSGLSLFFQANTAAGTAAARQCTNVPLINDVRAELAETLLVTAGPNTLTFIGGNQAIVNIGDDDEIVYQFSQTSYEGIEGGSLTPIVQQISGISTFPIEIQVITNNVAGANPATAGVDYEQLVAGVEILTFSSGSGPGTFQAISNSVSLIDDLFAEGTESFQFIGSVLDTSVAVFSPSTALGIINDDDNLQFELDVPASVTEGSANPFAEICVNLVSGQLQSQVTVMLDLQDGTALNNEDYSDSVNLNLNFPAGAAPNGAGAQQCTNVLIIDDERAELTESFTVSAGPNTLNFVSGSSAAIQIVDDDEVVFQFSETSYQGVEGDSLTPVVQQISGIATFPITVQVITNNVAGANAATGGVDYIQLFAGQEILTFSSGSAPGASQPISIPVDLDDDLFVEGTETFEFMGSILQGATVADFTPETADGIIIDNDVCEVEFEQSLYNAGQEGSSQVVCLVKANNAILENDVMVDVQTIAAVGLGIKTVNLDYIPLDDQVTFGPGLAATQCVTLQTLDDDIDEDPEVECVTINASPSAGAVGSILVVGGSTQVCCNDNDVSVFQFVDLMVTVTEGGPQVECCIELIMGQLGSLAIIQVEPISSIVPSAQIGAGFDVAPNVDSLFFAAGTQPGTPQATQCVTTTVLNDNQVEDTESYRLSASSNDPVQFVFTPGRNMKTVNIMEDPLDTVSICLEPPSTDTVPEGDSPHEECVQITGLPDRLEKSVSLMLSTSNGPSDQTDAQDPMDYLGLTNQLISFTVANQNDPQCVDIPIIDDQLCEFDESFTVNLMSNDPCVTINQALCTGTVIIQDNDVATVQSTDLSYSVMEGETLEIEIELVGQKGPGRECVVTVTTMDGTALSTVAWRDYFALPPTTFTFDSSNTLESVFINVCDDSKCEGDEEFEVILMTNSDGCEVANSPIPVTIIDDEVDTNGLGDDPHFSIALPSGELLCYTVQGEHGFSFNLISNQKMAMNAKFVPDARRQEVTWLGSIGIIVQNTNYMGSNETKLRFDVDTKSIYIGDKVQLEARNIEKLTFSNGKLTISETPPKEGFHYPSVYVNLEDVQLQFTIKYTNQHLDIYWHSTGGRLSNSHGLIGQFFRKGVEIDEVRKILIMPNKEPIPVMRRPVWSFMEREMPDEQLCWTAMNPGYQGEGLIDGTYFDYLVDDVLSTDFKFEEQ